VRLGLYSRYSSVVYNISFWCCFLCSALFVILWTSIVYAGDLSEVKKRGVLRHLGVPYANFVTGRGDGLDVELIKLFAQHLGVKYLYVKTSWKNVISDLIGKRIEPKGNNVRVLGPVPVKGDIIANGLTILPWRKKVVNYSIPTFPTQIWLVARANLPIKPIKPSGKIWDDIQATKRLMKGIVILGVANTCLDPSLYGLSRTGAKIRLFQGSMNDLAPAVFLGKAEATLLDVPDALLALAKWPGRIKVIGPLSPEQRMACAFDKASPRLLESFNRFMEQCWRDGTYVRLVKKYYPAVLEYYPRFFKR